MKISFLLPILVGLSLLSSHAADPSETAEAYFDVLKNKNYSEAAEFFAADSLGEFREMMDFLNTMPDAASGQILAVFFGPGSTKETVSKLSDKEFFGAFLAGVMKQAETAGALNFDSVEILGEVPEGDETVHVLTRSKISMGEVSVESIEVVSFKKAEGEWKALLSGKMKGMAAQLQKAFQQ